MKIGICNLGCKVNAYEAEALQGALEARGHVIADFKGINDCYIVNTCTVTQTSDQKSRQMLHLARRLNKDAIVVAMGCYSQLNQEKIKEIADIAVGSSNKLEVVRLIEEYKEEKKELFQFLDLDKTYDFEEMKLNRLFSHTRAFIKVEDGCENYCAYCAIPNARGKVRSRKIESVVKEINDLVEEGIKEVILAGINIGAYGLNSNSSLAKLIDEVLSKTSIYRLRLSSIEVTDFSEELFSVLTKYKTRICPHFHIPLQGANDHVLGLMGRKYKLDEYLKVVERLREIFPNFALTSDVIAGFSGERDEDFKEEVENIKNIGFYELHVFPYSPRPNTKAYLIKERVADDVKKERAAILRDISTKTRKDYINSYLGRVVDVIVEEKKDGLYFGHSGNYLDVYLEKGPEYAVNEIVRVRLYLEGTRLMGRKEE